MKYVNININYNSTALTVNIKIYMGTNKTKYYNL